MTPDAIALARAALEDDRARSAELAHRLVASGPKAAHVSASETHEITEHVLTVDEREPLLAAALLEAHRELEEMRAARDEACDLAANYVAASLGYGDGVTHEQAEAVDARIAALRAIGGGKP